MKRKVFKTGILSILVLAVAFINVSAANATLTVKANHEKLNVNYNYHGGTISLSGESNPGVDLVLKVATPAGHEKLMKKEHVGGVIWMNTEQIRFEDVPGAYFLMSTKQPEEILSLDERMAYGIGYDALAEAVEIDPLSSPEAEKTLFEEFINYKESKHLFSKKAGDIKLTSSDDGQSYSTMLEWPYQAAPGRYIVSAYAVMDGKVVEQAETEVLVEQVGMIKTFADMAQNRGGLYGIVAIMVALVAGFGVGLVFKKSGGAH